MLRPHVVWFGEALDSEVLLKTDQVLAACDLCLLVSETNYRIAGNFGGFTLIPQNFLHQIFIFLGSAVAYP